jgi:hypothetical protein
MPRLEVVALPDPLQIREMTASPPFQFVRTNACEDALCGLIEEVQGGNRTDVVG